MVQSTYIDQCFVHGESIKDYCVCVIVVNPEKAAEFSGSTEHHQQTLEDPLFVETVMRDMYKIGDSRKLNSLEKPKQVFLTYEPFDAEKNEVLTTTAKMKRNVARVYFKTQIEKMYADGPIQMNKKKD